MRWIIVFCILCSATFMALAEKQDGSIDSSVADVKKDNNKIDTGVAPISAS
jgi:hypothetical protein